MRYLKSYALFEGGNAFGTTRPIRQSEVAGTMEAIKDAVLPALGLEGLGVDCMTIGSAGKKKDPDDESGDIDIGFDVAAFSRKHGIDPGMALKYLYDRLNTQFPTMSTKLIRGLEVASIAYPIENDPGKGYVQLDFLPLKDMKWAKFIYHQPDYRKDESKYKSAHRNWLFCAILSQMIEDEEFDVDGERLAYHGYMMRLNDGLSRFRKTHVGKTKRLKNPKIVQDDEVTRDPNAFVRFLFGKGVRPPHVSTFEDAYALVTSPDYVYADRLRGIEDELVRFLKRVKLPVPDEVRRNINSRGQ